MIKMVLRAMRNQLGINILFVTGLVFVLTTLPFALSSLKSAMIQVEDDISNNARGSYDILVRPEGARTEIERKLGLVEDNYLTTGNGGISIKEWEDIKSFEEVEIAAPVASLGYFSGESLSFSMWSPETSSRIQSQMFTTDGVKHYELEKEIESIGVLVKQKAIPQKVQEYAAFSKGNARFMLETPNFMLPSTYHLMVGIDPTSEQQISGISFKGLNENVAVDSSIYGFAGDAPIIPVLSLTDPMVPVESKITWENLDIHEEQATKWKRELGLPENEDLEFYMDEDQKFLDMLLSYPAHTKKEYKVNFSDEIKPFKYDPFKINEDLEVVSNQGGVYSGNVGARLAFYSAKPIHYRQQQDSLLVNELDQFKGIPVYREIYEKGAPIEDKIPFVLHPVGNYTVSDSQASLAASPLGLYQLAPVMLVKDSEGQRLEQPKEVHSTIYPGSFVPSPAHGIIHIKDTELIKGDKPIDAIRIRVKDITLYNQAAEQKVEALAEKLLLMGYVVDVVAGSSYQNIEVEVEGIGTVIQPWTTLGAAASIVEGWSGTTVILTVIFMLTAFIYLLNRLYFYRNRKMQEVQLLLQFGWEPRRVKGIVRIELFLILALSWIISIILILITSNYIDIANVTHLLSWNVCFGGLAVICMLAFIEWKWKTPVLNRKRGKEGKSDKVSGPILLLIKSIQHYKPFIIASFLQVILVGALSVFVLLAIDATAKQTSITMLGQHVNFQISSLHIVMIASAYVLVIITLGESLISLYSYRKTEVGVFRSIGWSHVHITNQFLKELMIWSSAAVIVGHLSGYLMYLYLYTSSLETVFAIGTSLILFEFFIMLLGFIVIKSLLNKNLHQTIQLQRVKQTIKIAK